MALLNGLVASKLAYTMFQVKSVSTWTVLIIKKNFRPNMSGLKFLSDFENVAECKKKYNCKRNFRKFIRSGIFKN